MKYPSAIGCISKSVFENPQPVHVEVACCILRASENIRFEGGVQ